MKTSNKNLLNLFSYVAVILVAVLILIKNLFPIIGIVINGTFINVIETIEELLVLIVIGISAYNYAVNKKKAIKITLLVAIIIFVVGVVLIWFR